MAGPSAGPTAEASGGAPDRPDLAAVAVSVDAVARGLDKPLWVTGAGDGSVRLFIAEQGGRIRQAIAENLSGPILDVEDEDGDGVLITME